MTAHSSVNWPKMQTAKRTNPYWVGRKHALEKRQFLIHRNGKHYDSRSAQDSYQRGYNDGLKVRGTSTL